MECVAYWKSDDKTYMTTIIDVFDNEILVFLEMQLLGDIFQHSEKEITHLKMSLE